MINRSNASLLVPRHVAPKQHTPFDDLTVAVAFDVVPRIKQLRLPPEYSNDQQIRELISQANQVSELGKQHKNIIASLDDDTIIVFGGHQTLFDTIGTIIGETDTYTVLTPKVSNMKLLEAIIVVDGFKLTKNTGSRLIPDSDRVIQVQQWADEARAVGFRTPDTFKTRETLNKYQVASTLALAHRGGMMLADEVGLGKTASFVCGALSLAQYKREVGVQQLWPYVIVTKKSLVGNTANEIRMWHHDAVVEVLKGTGRAPINPDAEFILLNADILTHRLADILLCDPVGVVFDEAHLLKNPQSKRSVAAKKLVQHILKHNDYPYTICATATPMPNKPVELWHQLQLSNTSHYPVAEAKKHVQLPPRIVTRQANKKLNITEYRRNTNDRTVFEHRYCDAKATIFGWSADGSSNEDELGRVLNSHVMIRRTKDDVMFPSPGLHQSFLEVTPDSELMDEYRKAEQHLFSYLVDRLLECQGDGDMDFRDFMKNITIIENKIINGGAIMKMTETRKLVGRMKVEPVVQWLRRFCEGDHDITGGDTSRNKIIVFAYHRDVQQALIEHPELQKYGVGSITSDTKHVSEVVEKFQNPEGDVRVLICYPGAREGLTLTAAKDVLITELPLMPDWVVQMAGRCWARLSRDYEPHEAWIHYAVVEDTIDDYLRQCIITKKETINKIMNAVPEKNISTTDKGGETTVLSGMVLDAFEQFTQREGNQ